MWFSMVTDVVRGPMHYLRLSQETGIDRTKIDRLDCCPVRRTTIRDDMGTNHVDLALAEEGGKA